MPYTPPQSSSGASVWGGITGTLGDQTDLVSAIDAKQDALGFTAVPTTRTVNGVNLSSNITLTQDDIGDGTTYKQYSSTEKTKLAGIATGAEVNVQVDWDQADSGADDYIKNKPSSFGLTQPQILARSLGA